MGSVNKLRPTNREVYLSGLPEEIYSKDRSSHMVRIMDAVCGGAGAGAARNQLMLKRLQTNLEETHYGDLDELYGRAFGFRRLESESYSYNPKSNLLTGEQMDEVEAKDAMYRARIYKYMLAFQYGGTAYGIQLAAESACAKPCNVLEAWKFYEGVNVADGDQAALTPGYYEQANYNEYIVVVDDAEVTEADRYNINKVTKNIRPQDAIMTVVQRDEFFDKLILETKEDETVEPRGVESSSNLWQVKRYVTGRPDWEYDVDDDLNFWVSPNERREAPTQSLVNHQEEAFDFTYLINDVSASSEHIGNFDVRHSGAFYYLDMDNRTDLQKAANAVSDVSSKLYSASYFGSDGMADWSYPIDYTPLVNEKFNEQARSSRMWSSDEAYPDDKPTEWFEVRLDKGIPVNKLTFDISKKPVEIIPYVLLSDTEETWERITNEYGTQLSYTCRTWGGASTTGDMFSVSFKFNLAQAYGFRLVFNRLDVPYYKTLSDGALKEQDFPYSIDMSNFALHYDIKRKEDYVDATFEDPFGNKVETEFYERNEECLLDADSSTFWCSQPNTLQESVEYLIFDLRDGDGNAQRVNNMTISAVWGGCQMNVYSTEDSDPATASWKPYPSVYTLQSVKYSLPLRKVKFIKLEFTTLSSIPYTVIDDDISVFERDYPYEIKHYFDNQPASTYSMELYRQLLSTQDTPIYENNLGVYDTIGTSNIYQQIEQKRTIADTISQTNNPLYLPILVTPDSWRFTDNGAIASILGDSMRYENQLPSSARPPVSGTVLNMRFYEEGQHEYKIQQNMRSNDLAYVVAIKDISFGISGVRAIIEPDSEFVAFVADESVVEKNTGFELTNDERMVPTMESMNSLEFINLNSVIAFKTFDFAVNQREPREVFDYPSDMIQEWGAMNSEVESTEFGVSGTVLHANLSSGDSGISSESKLVRSQSIASIQVDVFSVEPRTWYLQCLDLSEEEVFNTKYEVEGGKWVTIGNTFTPQVGGMWWSNAYDYRVRIPIDGFVPAGTTVFVPNIDFDTLRNQSTPMIREDLKDFRCIYYNGVQCQEIDCDITDNMEVWFRIQDDIPEGASADGYYDYDINAFVGAYYFYFGYANESREPMRDYHAVFKPVELPCYEMTEHDPSGSITYETGKGAHIANADAWLEMSTAFRIDAGAGFITFEYTPDTDLDKVPEGQRGTASERYILDYQDETRRLSVYTYEQQLYVVIQEPDGFLNSFITHADFNEGVKSFVLIQWSAQGERSIYQTPTQIDAENKRGRNMEVWIDGTECENIDNIYNTRTYNNGTY